MNLLYLSPHYPSHYAQFVESLARHQIRVYGITDLPDEALDSRLRQSLTAHYRVSRLENTDEVLRACSFFEEHFGKIDRVESHLEPWLDLEALIREKFNVSGPKPDELLFIKHKSKMKDVFRRASVPCARGMIVSTIEECKKFIKQYPVFIKPDVGVGAADTYTINSEDDLKYFFAAKRDYDYFLEDFVDGDIVSFDGLTDANNNIVFYTSHIFSNDVHRIVKNNENLWYYSQRNLPEELERYGKAVVKAANIREKFFHIEFFKVNNHYQALEINMRPPGGITTHLFNFACDIDVYDWWASVIANENVKREYTRKYHAAHIGRRYDGRAYKHSVDELYDKWGDKIVHSCPMNPIEYSVMGHWVYVARSENEEEMMQIINDFIAEA